MDWRRGVVIKGGLTAALTLAAGLACSAPAAHASTYTLSGTSVDLTLTTDAGNNITSASGTFFGDTVDLAGGQPGGPAFSSPGNYFVYDNILLPNLTPAFDNLGLLLGYVSGPSPFTYGNISAIPGGGGTYGFYEYRPDTYLGSEDLTLAATPLPATFPLLATSLFALGLFGWRRKRKAQGAAAA